MMDPTNNQDTNSMGTPTRTVVVTPTFNEAESLPTLVTRLRDAVADLHIIVVDDGSPDGTAALARTLNQGDITVIERAGKQGLASAYLEGFTVAFGLNAKRIVQMDADLSHDPNDVPRLTASQSALAIGSRYVSGGGTKNWPIQRRLLSRFGSLWVRGWLGMPYRDLTSGFLSWDPETLQHLVQRPIHSDGYAFQVELKWRAFTADVSIEEYPILFTERIGGTSKMSRAIALEAAWIVPSFRWSR